MLTWQQVKDRLAELTPEQLAMKASIVQPLGDGEFTLYVVEDTSLASEMTSYNLDEVWEEVTEPNLPCLVLSN